MPAARSKLFGELFGNRHLLKNYCQLLAELLSTWTLVLALDATYPPVTKKWGSWKPWSHDSDPSTLILEAWLTWDGMIIVDFDISGLGPGSMDLDFEAPRPRIWYDFNDFADVGSWILLIRHNFASFRPWTWGCFSLILMQQSLGYETTLLLLTCRGPWSQRISIDLESLYVLSPSKACHGPWAT